MYNPYDTEKYPKRKNPRLKAYDYTSENYYFITICTYDKLCIFGVPGQMNPLGEIAEQGILKIPEHCEGIKIDKYVVMPNHVHLLVYSNGKRDIKTVIGSYKSYVTRLIHKEYPELRVWQESFHDHIVRNERGYQNIWLYIDSNPANWEKDCFFIK
ncbi:MAG: transposase [Oscillospiraceae bacterium]|nr:transposase [Oscillospiraceae bacterium]MBQ7130497.1 transposase [Oscillospiraceae bacterium]